MEGAGLGEVENGVIISQLLVDRGLSLGDTFVLDRALTELQVVGIVGEHNIGHVPIIYNPRSANGRRPHTARPEGRHPARSYRIFCSTMRASWRCKLDSTVDLQTLEDADIDIGTLTIDKQTAYEASSGYREELATVRMIQGFLIVISAVVIGAFFTVWTIQRTREIGLIKALGGSNLYLLKDALGQVLLLMLAATLVGTSAALWLGQRFIESGNPFVLDPPTVLGSSLFLIVAGLVGSAISIRLITRVDPIIALGTER